MELKPMPESVEQEFQDALDSPYVIRIVDMLLQETNQSIFKTILLFLRNNPERLPKYNQEMKELRRKLSGLQKFSQGHLKYSINTTPPAINGFIQIILDMYGQDQVKLKNLRGAIVEKLAIGLVSSRCNEDECGNNYCFIDNNPYYKSPQIDVAVLAKSTLQIEGYSCKINLSWFVDRHCDQLLELANQAQQRGFRTHIGTVSFDHSHIAMQWLTNLKCTASIKAYGADNIMELRQDPFK